MNIHLSRDEIEAMRIHSADILAELVTKEAEPRKRPFAKRNDGRNRRKARRAAIRAKMAWLQD